MSGVSVHGDLERTLREVIKLKPELPWRPQGAGDARVMGYLLKEAANGEGDQPKRKKCVAVNKAERIGDLKSVLTLDMDVQSLEFAQLFF